MSGGWSSAGELDGRDLRFAIVASRFNAEVVDALVAGAEERLRAADVDPEAIEVLRVPGAWEIPWALSAVARRGGVDGMVALGAVIRGETAHFDYICAEASGGISRVSLEHDLPIGFGLLTCDTVEQARARAGGAGGNKGWEAAEAALEMVRLGRTLRGSAG